MGPPERRQGMLVGRARSERERERERGRDRERERERERDRDRERERASAAQRSEAVLCKIPFVYDVHVPLFNL